MIHSLFITVLCSFLCPLSVSDTVSDREDTAVTSDLMRECSSCLCFLQAESEFIFVIHQRTQAPFERISSRGSKIFLSRTPPTSPLSKAPPHFIWPFSAQRLCACRPETTTISSLQSQKLSPLKMAPKVANLNSLFTEPPLPVCECVYMCFCELSCDSHLLLCNPVVMLAPGSRARAALRVPFGYGLSNTTSPRQNARHPPLGKRGWREEQSSLRMGSGGGGGWA